MFTLYIIRESFFTSIRNILVCFFLDDSVTGSSEDVSSQNEFATRWLERTELEISDKLPGEYILLHLLTYSQTKTSKMQLLRYLTGSQTPRFKPCHI